MPTISAYLSNDHHRCDEYFVEAEQQAARRDFAAARAGHSAFVAAMTRHFAIEEEILFPAFEQATGQRSGPTAVMRHEHGQMRALFDEMDAALGRGSDQAFLAASETLLVFMRQHNAKEEQILYPMIDRTFSDGSDLIANMERLAGG